MDTGIRRRALCTAALMIAGCSGDDGASAGRRGPEIRDSAGVRVVINHEPHWGPGEGWRVSEEPVLRIGMVDGPQPYLFDRIEGVTRLSDGTIVVLNSGDGQVRYFGADGTHMRSVGGEGRGPGEMRAGRWLQRLPGDEVQVTHTDGSLRYAADGTLVSDDRLDWGGIHTLSRAAGPGFSAGFLMESCGMPTPLLLEKTVLLCATTYTDVRFLPQEPGIHATEAMVATSDFALETLDTLGVFTMSHLAAYRGEGRVWPTRLSPPYGPWGRLRVSGSPAHLTFTDKRAYRIQVHPIGAPEQRLVIERIGGLRPPTQAERDSYDRAFDTDRSRPAGDPDSFRGQVAVSDSLSMVAGYPPPLVDDLRAVWAPIGIALDSVPDPRPYDVFDADGIYLGVVMLPGDLQVYEIGADYVLGVTRDDLRVEYVTMYRLEGRSR